MTYAVLSLICLVIRELSLSIDRRYSRSGSRQYLDALAYSRCVSLLTILYHTPDVVIFTLLNHIESGIPTSWGADLAVCPLSQA